MRSRQPMSVIRRHFECVYRELFSRIRTYSRRFNDRAEAQAEMVAFSWFNLVRKARRTGTLLSASALAHVSYLRHRSGRVVSGYSVKDVLADACFRTGRVKVFRLSQIAAPNGQHAVDDEVAHSIALALSTRERERPDVRAATRIDWAEFAQRLPWRERKILKWLAIGFSKTQISRRLKLSNGRISQILRVIGEELRTFFGPDSIPVLAAA